MENYLNKYFADELTADEKVDFLMEVGENGELKEKFIENQNLLALIDWTLPGNEKEGEVVQQKLNEFMHAMKLHKK